MATYSISIFIALSNKGATAGCNDAMTFVPSLICWLLPCHPSHPSSHSRGRFVVSSHTGHEKQSRLADIPLQLQLYKLGNRRKVRLFEANQRGMDKKSESMHNKTQKAMGVGEERQATKKDEGRAHSGGWLYASRYPRDHDKYTN
jgi:hypothetical protein